MKTSLLLLPLLIFPLFVSAQAPRWVVVDFQKVFESFTSLQDSDRAIKLEIQQFRETQSAKIEELNRQKQRFQQLREQAANSEVTDEDREALVEQATALFEEVRAMEQALQQSQSEFNTQAEAKIGRLRRKLADQVSAHIDQMATDQGWSLVLDSSAVGGNGLPIVQYAERSLDVTVDVINSLNASVAKVADEREEAPAVEPGAE